MEFHAVHRLRPSWVDDEMLDRLQDSMARDAPTHLDEAAGQQQAHFTRQLRAQRLVQRRTRALDLDLLTSCVVIDAC